MKFSENVFFFFFFFSIIFPRVLSQLFNKRREYGSRCAAEACLDVSGKGVGAYTGLVNVKKKRKEKKKKKTLF